MKSYCENAIKWISSLSGFQGGNPGAAIWFCGLEYQGNDLDVIDNPDKWHDVENPPYLSTIEYVKPEHGGQEFNQCISRIAQSFHGDKKVITNPFDKDGRLFKLNLYSLPQKATGEFFNEETYLKTGFKTKSELRTISMRTGIEGLPSRFDNFKTLLNKHKENVKVIVGCSRDAACDFLIAFGKDEEFYKCRNELKINEEAISKSGNKSNYISWCHLSSGQILFVIPFLGGRNPAFKSDEFMDLVAKKILKVLNE